MTGLRWRVLPEERQVMFSPAWFLPVDLVTGGHPIEPLRVVLDLQDERGDWVPTEIVAVVTPSGAVAYPGLGRRREPLTAPAQRYRARFEADGYNPFYRVVGDGLQFHASPYDDTNPPAQRASLRRVRLAPSVRYRFPAAVRRLYGTVETPSGTPVADASVRGPVAAGRTERTVTDRKGHFALPLRWSPPGPVVVRAADLRSQPPRTGQLTVQLPDDLTRNQRIQVQ